MTDNRIIEAARRIGKSAQEFNRHPPKWFYWVAFIVIVFAAQLIRVSLH